MIKKLKEQYHPTDYAKVIGTKTNIHKVSYFLKEDVQTLHKKRILIIDLEFSMNKHIFEIGGIVLNNEKVEQLIFKEYSLPKGEPYFSFEKNGFITTPINKGKSLFKDKDWLFSLLESVDYIVVHNYPAEAQCFFKLLFPNHPYDINKIKYFNEHKIICTNYSFKNKYFTNQGMEKFSNSDLASNFGWKFIDMGNKYKVVNKVLNVEFEVDKPKNVVSALHNSFFDSLITLTNFISAKKIRER